MISLGSSNGGRSPTAFRTPFKRPAQAGNYTPQLPATAFYSHFNPFRKVMERMASYRSPNLPNMPAAMSPGVTSAPPGSNGPAPTFPAGIPADTAPAPQTVNGFGRGFGYFGADAGPVAAVPGPSAPVAAMAAMNKRSRGMPYASPFPYRTIRTGLYPDVRSTSSGVHAGVYGVGQTVRGLLPAAYPNVGRPAGDYYQR
jgi:hypothetical protein